MKRFVRSLLVACLSVTVPAFPASSLEVDPVRIVAEAPGVGVQGRVTVRNVTGRKQPIEITFDRRVVAEDGSTEFVPENESFIAFPSQFLLQPGTAQAFQFRYVGEAFEDQSRSYVIRISEVPVSDLQGVVIQVVYEFGAALYIVPPGAEANLRFQNVSPMGDGRYAVQVRNSGTRHHVLGRTGLAEIRGAADALRGVPEAYLANIGNPILPPNMTRRFIIGPDDEVR